MGDSILVQQVVEVSELPIVVGACTWISSQQYTNVVTVSGNKTSSMAFCGWGCTANTNNLASAYLTLTEGTEVMVSGQRLGYAIYFKYTTGAIQARNNFGGMCATFTAYVKFN